VKLRILCKSPGPPNCNADSPHHSWAVRELGADIRYYGDRPQLMDFLCRGCDVVLYFDVMGGPSWPGIEVFKRARRHCRLVSMLGDGGCKHARPVLQRYKDEDAFDAVVNIDGTTDWPQRPDKDWTYFGMFDPRPYDKEMPRVRMLGYKGATGAMREAVARSLDGLLDAEFFRGRYDDNPSYQAYCDWMLSTKAVVNSTWSTDHHVKNCRGRVNEAALAGCLLFETKGSATGLYFTPGEDYLEYGSGTREEAITGRFDVSVIRETLARPDFDEYAEAMGKRFKAKMLERYGPERFWQKVCGV
jgi:hypothetical protein